MTAIIIIILLFLAAGTVYSTRYISVSRHIVRSGRIPAEFDGFTIVQLSDVHSTSFGNGNTRLLKKVEGEKPDIVVLTGDMVSRTDKDYSVFLSLAKELARRYTVYYILGNHEQRLESKGLIAPLLDGLSSAGVTVLDDEKIVIARGNARIDLYGGKHDLPRYRPQKFGAAALTARDMTDIFGKCEKENFKILLIHNPLYFDAYSDWGADITISGHVHGGIIKLPFIGALLSPEHRFFPKYSEGIYERDGKKMVVSRGLGGDPRFGSLPEVMAIRLENTK